MVKTHRSDDPFSLAVIYVEMLTGIHPFNGATKNARNREPNLDQLPKNDRDIVRKALHPNAQERWNSATALLSALEGTVDKQDECQDRFVSLISKTQSVQPATVAVETAQDLNQALCDLIMAAGGCIDDELAATPKLFDDVNALQFEIVVELPLGAAKVKLVHLAKEWFGDEIRETENEVAFRINLPQKLWQQWLGRHPGLNVQAELQRVHPITSTPIHVAITIQSVECDQQQGRQLLNEMGPKILEQAQSLLLINSEKRTQDRILWPHPLQIIPVDNEGNLDEPIECRGKDLSLRGMGFYLPEEIETTNVFIRLPNDVHPPSVSIPANLVRAKRCADGWYEVGALFRLPPLRDSQIERCETGLNRYKQTSDAPSSNANRRASVEARPLS